MTVTIVNSAGDTVATLVRDWPVVRYKQFSLRWNGRTGTARSYTVTNAGPEGTTIVTPINTGNPAPAGEYRVRVSLHEQHRTVLSPTGFTLVTKVSRSHAVIRRIATTAAQPRRDRGGLQSARWR